MLTFIVRVLITAFAIQFVLPMVNGIHFTGTFFPDAIVYAVLFGVVSWVVDLLLTLVAVVLTGATGGLAAPLVVLSLILGWWLIPALQLQALASWFPHHFAVDGWVPAILGGLVMLVINYFTRKLSSRSAN